MAPHARWSELAESALTTTKTGEVDCVLVHAKKLIRIEGDIAYVRLTKGFEAVIDAADVPIVAPFNWHVRVKPNATSYAVARTRDANGVRSDVFMHRLIVQTPSGFHTDHQDGDGLNNRRINLRVATHSQNMHNARQRLDNSSGFKGVSWKKDKAKWLARIRFHGMLSHLGYHDTPEAAHHAYCRAAERLHGEFARHQ